MSAPRKMANEVLFKDNQGCVDSVFRLSNGSVVTRISGYNHNNKMALMVEDTGNGLIAKFLPMRSLEQAHYICMDYSQARDLVLALSAFQSELRFAPLNGGDA